MYACRVIARVNNEEENVEGQKRKTMTGTIMVSGLGQMRANQSDTKLAWEMFHKIYRMYSDIKNKEETNTYLMLTWMSYHKETNKVSKTTVNSHGNHQNKFPFQLIMIVSPDFHQIHPWSTQVCNCDEIGFDPNVKCHKVVCTYKFF